MCIRDRLMASEVADALEQVEENDEPGLVSIATGRLPYPYMEKYADWIRKKFPNRTINIYPIRNDFFGESITVSGLITAKAVSYTHLTLKTDGKSTCI